MMGLQRRAHARLIVTAAVVSAVALALGGCSSASSATAGGSKKQDLQIGMVDGITGPIAVAGQSNICGAVIGAEAVNHGQVAHVKISLTVKDDQGAPTTAVQAATQLTNAGDKIIMGGTTETLVGPRLPITNRAGVLDTLGVTQSSTMVSTAKLPLRFGPSTAENGVAISALMKKLAPKSVAFVEVQSDYGSQSVAAVKAALDPSIVDKGTIVVPPTQTDSSNVVSQLNSWNADAVVVFLAGNTAPIDFMTRYKAAGLSGKLIFGAELLTSNQVAAAKGAAEGILTVNSYPPATSNPANKQLEADFKKYGPSISECQGKTIDALLVFNYETVVVLAEAASKTGSVDPSVLRKKVISQSWKVPSGTATFSKSGQANVTFTDQIAKGNSVVPYNG